MALEIWVEKYRPKQLDDYIAAPEFKEFLNEVIETGNVPHILLHSRQPGTGKTTAAKMIGAVTGYDTMYINASNERNIDTIRDKVSNFASSAGFTDLKLIILDECDYMTPTAQAALRSVMETFANTSRFILTCNYVEQLIAPLVSRCQVFELAIPSQKAAAQRLIHILDSEKVKYSLEDVKKIIQVGFPDLRKIINLAQQSSSNGVLTVTGISSISQSDALINALCEKITPGAKYKKVYQLVVDSHNGHNLPYYRALFDAVEKIKPTAQAQAIIDIGEASKWDVFAPDKIIHLMALIAKLI